MSHHAYVVAGDIGEGIADALAFGERELGLSPVGNPDVLIFRHMHLSVEDARLFSDIVPRRPVGGGARLLILAAERLFHEAQNALLKLLEEPPLGTVIVLVVPSFGDLLPTVRSRLLPLPVATAGKKRTSSDMIYHISLAEEFLSGSVALREKIIKKILDRAKKDAPEEKQAARAEALLLLRGLSLLFYKRHVKTPSSEPRAVLRDLDRLIPILRERSAPLKPILEHISLVLRGIDKNIYM